MAKLGINTGTNADDGTGDSLRVGAGKINSNFNEVYSLLTGAGNNGTTLLSGIVTSVTAGSNITLSGGPTGAIQITAAALTGTGFFTNNSTGIHTTGSVGIGTTTAENNGLSVPLGNVKVGKGLTTLNLNVAGVTTFSGGDINIKGDGTVDTTGVFWDASVATLEFDDLAKIAFGEGSDLTLYHDENNSWIKDQATGNLLIDSNGAAVKITKAGAAETMAEFNTDGPVKLFHNNVRVLETVSTGATVVGDLYVGGDLFVLDDVTYNEMNSVNLNVSGVSTFAGDVSVGVSTLFVDVSTARIGINTDVPSHALDVKGDLGVVGISSIVGNTAVTGISTINGRLQVNTTGISSFTGTVHAAGINVTSADLTITSATIRRGAGLLWQLGGSDPQYYSGTPGGAVGDHIFKTFSGGSQAEQFRILPHGGIKAVGVATAAQFRTTGDLHVTNIVGAAASIAGIVTATTFVGDLTGNADTVTVTADNATDSTHYPLFAGAVSGNLGGETDSGFTYNPSSGYLTATRFIGYLQGEAATASDLSSAGTVKIRAASYALGNVFAHRAASFAYNDTMVQSFFYNT